MEKNAPNPHSLEERKAQCKPIVLIIDDNPQYAKLFDLLSDRLEISTYIVSSCGAGMKALEKFSFDIILMDWLMPEVDGPCCTKKIREMEKKTGKKTPIIGVTGYIKADREKCIEAGMDDYLAIPFTLEELHDKLCQWLQTKTE